MTRRPQANLKNRTSRRSVTALPKPIKKSVHLGQRSRGRVDSSNNYMPPEDWYELTENGFRVVTQDPGRGYQHVVTAREVEGRLAELPATFLEPLEAVQLSRMTRKKQRFPCYGMQWGNAIYLYPLEDGLIEYFSRPPRPADYNDTRAFGGRWIDEGGGRWKLVWTPETIRDFYLNNVLIHELGHLLDRRNGSYRDRERFAEWFAIEHGQRTRRHPQAARQRSRRRHGRK